MGHHTSTCQIFWTTGPNQLSHSGWGPRTIYWKNCSSSLLLCFTWNLLNPTSIPGISNSPLLQAHCPSLALCPGAHSVLPTQSWPCQEVSVACEGLNDGPGNRWLSASLPLLGWKILKRMLHGFSEGLCGLEPQPMLLAVNSSIVPLVLAYFPFTISIFLVLYFLPLWDHLPEYTPHFSGGNPGWGSWCWEWPKKAVPSDGVMGVDRSVAGPLCWG